MSCYKLFTGIYNEVIKPLNNFNAIILLSLFFQKGNEFLRDMCPRC